MFPSFIATIKPSNKTTTPNYIYTSVPYNIPVATTGIVYGNPSVAFKSALPGAGEKPHFAKSLRCNKNNLLKSYQTSPYHRAIKCGEKAEPVTESELEYTAVQEIKLSCIEVQTDGTSVLQCKRTN